MSYEQVKAKLSHKYLTIGDLAKKAKKRMPFVSWEYLDSGTGKEQLIQRNLEAFKEITFKPQFCKGELNPKLETEVLGQNFKAPFGIAPIGLTGLMWPNTEVYLAQTAREYQLPYTLSTVATRTPETIGPYVGDMGWFQLYPPRSLDFRKSLLESAWQNGFHTMLVTCDIPVPSRRERTQKAGIGANSIVTPRFIWEALTHPTWLRETLKHGFPKLQMVENYSKIKSVKSIKEYVSRELGGTLSWEYCKELRDAWQGKLLLKGVLHPKDAEKAIELGFDGVVVSNHGGRQFDGAIASLEALPEIVQVTKGKAAIVFDGGVRSGLDILKALSLGADFVLLGRAFIYGVAALGQYGGHQVVEILKDQLINNMYKLGVEDIESISNI
ncbi:MAG: alpha-hydroxy acid oxidase [Bacteroidota bacterium]